MESLGNNILYGEKRIQDFKKFIEQKDIIKMLSDKTFKADETIATSRVLNHWEKLGLLDNEREKGKGWRKFSLTELAWIEIIKELRKFGYPNEDILKIKEDLTAQDIDQSNPKISNNTIIQYYISRMFSGQKVNVLIFSNKQILLAFQSEMPLLHKNADHGNYIYIDLNRAMATRIPNSNFNKTDHAIELSRQELEALYQIRTGNCSEVTIKLKNGKITTLELAKEIDSQTRIIDILKSGNFQNISIKQRDGKIVDIKRTELHKV